MADAPQFANPPVAELVLGVQFSPLTKLTSGHFGLFWKTLGEEWINPVDDLPLEDQFELFNGPVGIQMPSVQFRLEPVRLPGRYRINNKSQDRMIQVQGTRFHLNWRKRNGFYPSYKRLITEFEERLTKFIAFAENAGLGTVTMNQWEVTYIDAFPQGEFWQTPSDWSYVLPGLFGTLRSADGLVLETRKAEWRYEIPPKRGRLHLGAQVGRVSDDGQLSLLLHTTVRGPVGKGVCETLRAGLDLGHKSALDMFLTVTSDETKKKMGIKP